MIVEIGSKRMRGRIRVGGIHAAGPALFALEKICPGKMATISGADLFTRRDDPRGLHAILVNQSLTIWTCWRELSRTPALYLLSSP
jgi:hypothetical protein